jgi:OOP family OmpA-OmpF porin
MKLNFSRRLALTILSATMLRPNILFGQTIEYLSDDEALALEHKTRYSRMRRFVESYNIAPSPQFYDYIVPAQAMPSDFAHNVPVLRIVFPEHTFFDTGSAVVLPGAYSIISAMAAMLDGDVPDVNVFVAGHTDNRGSEEFNHNLSISRAKAVADLLAAKRLQTYPIWSIGFGESLPLYPNNSDVAMSYNRRVEFLVGARPEAVAYWLKGQYDLVCKTSDSKEKLRCLLDVTKVRRVYEAEETVQHIKVANPSPHRLRVAGESAQLKTDLAPRRIVIQLDERRLYVPNIEH